MPVGPNGQIRPDSTMSAVIMACKIATGEVEEKYIDSKDGSEDSGGDSESPSPEARSI